MLEVEVKIKVCLKDVMTKLSELGFVKGSVEYEKDVYFNSDNYDLKAADKALRIRQHRNKLTGKQNFVMNFKGPKVDETTMTREETEFDIPDFEHGEKLFNGLGFYAAGVVEKNRIHYSKGKITCCLDTVTGLGEFLEIEILAEDKDYDKAVEIIKDLLSKLGLNMEDTIRHSYLSMLNE